MNDAERGVAVLDRLRDDAQRDEVVHALEIDRLPLQFEVNAVETLDAAVERDHWNLRVLQLASQRARELVDHRFGVLAPCLDLCPQRLVRFRLEVFERGHAFGSTTSGRKSSASRGSSM